MIFVHAGRVTPGAAGAISHVVSGVWPYIARGVWQPSAATNMVSAQIAKVRKLTRELAKSAKFPIEIVGFIGRSLSSFLR